MTKLTKKAITERIRAIANNAELSVPLAGDAEQFVMDILRKHPDWTVKQGAGVSAVVVKENRAYGYRPTRGFWLKRIDGTEVDISWVEALSPTPHDRKVKLALRHLIADQSHEYRANLTSMSNLVRCESCQNETHVDNADVDHRPPCEFETLVQSFLVDMCIGFDDIKIAPHEDKDLKDKLQDEKLAEDWREWHRKRSQLWLICKPCHKQLTAARKKR